MVATEAWLAPGVDIAISGHGLVPEGQLVNRTEGANNAKIPDPTAIPGLEALLTVASLCNTAALSQDAEGEWVGVGDATSIALTVCMLCTGWTFVGVCGCGCG